MNPLPPPPVPAKLRELLKDYPDLIWRLQGVLDRYFQKPDRSIPFDGAIWMLEGQLGEFISEAREELNAAQSDDDPEQIRKAKDKDFAVGRARLNMGSMSDLFDYCKERGLL